MEKFPKWIEILPSLAWLLFMVAPLLVQCPPFDIPGTRIQLFSVLFVLMMLSSCDFFAFVRQNFSGTLANKSIGFINFNQNYIIALMILSFMVLSIMNLWLMPMIPAIEWYSGATSNTIELSQLRYMATKKLFVPKLLLYSFNWVLLIFVPVSITMLLRSARYYLATVIFLWALFYSTMTMAKLPAISMTFSLLLSLSCVFSGLSVLIKRMMAIALILFMATVIAVLAMTHTKTLESSTKNYISKYESGDPRSFNTLADKFRSMGFVSAKQLPEEAPNFTASIGYTVNRAWLTPVDVSIRWYEYFTHVRSPMGWASVFQLTDEEFAPSRLVGLWAYVDKYPQYYLPTINAYASFDADAFSRGGVPGVILATFGLVFFRLLMFFVRGPGAATSSAYAVGIGLMTLLPIQASLGAILVANGLLLVLVLIWILAASNRDRRV